MARFGPSPVSELTTRSVTGPSASKPVVLTFCAAGSVVDCAGLSCPGVPPHAATRNASTTSATALSERGVMFGLPLPLRAAQERRLESISVRAVDGAPRVDDPATVVH